MNLLKISLIVVILALVFSTAANAQNATVPATMAPDSSSASSAEPALKVDSGDTAWMLASAALVMVMTPGLAFFYGGLVRAQHSLNTLLMSFVSLGLITVHWVVFGYTFAFAPGSQGYGSFKWVGLRNVGAEPNADYAATIPHTVYMVYQMMFAIITPAIISGAIVERMSFRSYCIFILVWATICYDTLAHWVWSGWTEVGSDGVSHTKLGWMRNFGALDFAGGTVVHMSSGYSALIACIIVGKRKDIDLKKPLEPHNVPFVLLGAALLWFGWFGFNAGSALSSGGIAGLAFSNTQIATGTAFVTWVLMDEIVKKKITATGAASGAVVGLVAITPAAGYVHLQSSIAFGIIGVLAVYGSLELKAKLAPKLFPQLDDTLDVFCCHGIGGTVGSLLVGFFASTDVNPAGANGVFFGGGFLLGAQLAVICMTLLLSCITTAGILLILKFTIGLDHKGNVPDSMDEKEHGARAYNLNAAAKDAEKASISSIELGVHGDRTSFNAPTEVTLD